MFKELSVFSLLLIGFDAMASNGRTTPPVSPNAGRQVPNIYAERAAAQAAHTNYRVQPNVNLLGHFNNAPVTPPVQILTAQLAALGLGNGTNNNPPQQ